MSIIKKITKIIFILVIGIAPFILGLYYSLMESDSYLNMIIGGFLSMSISLILIGVLFGSLKDNESNVMTLCGFITAVISGTLYFGNSIIHLIG
jgi:hypothetical protein